MRIEIQLRNGKKIVIANAFLLEQENSGDGFIVFPEDSASQVITGYLSSEIYIYRGRPGFLMWKAYFSIECLNANGATNGQIEGKLADKIPFTIWS